MLVKDLYQLTQQAKDKFCTTDCPCFINSTNMKSNLTTWLTTNKKVFNDKNTSFINYRSCIKDPAVEANGILLGTL